MSGDLRAVRAVLWMSRVVEQTSNCETVAKYYEPSAIYVARFNSRVDV